MITLLVESVRCFRARKSSRSSLFLPAVFTPSAPKVARSNAASATTAPRMIQRVRMLVRVTQSTSGRILPPQRERQIERHMIQREPTRAEA